MIAISVELLHGTFRGDPDGTANTGRLTAPEWPPSPFRLFSSFVAADGTRERCLVTDGSELEWFEELPPPFIRADKDYRCVEIQSRFVVEHRGNAFKSSHQEYPGRKATSIRPGWRVAPKDPNLVYLWDVTPPPEATLLALKRRAARIGYLGASDSPVRVRVVCPVREKERNAEFVPDPAGTLAVNVPARGDLRTLDRMYEDWVQRGASVARSQYPGLRHEAMYRDPRIASPPDRGGVVVWLRIEPAVSGRRVGTVTALFKDAILSQYQQIFSAPPAILHGHGLGKSGYELARFLALPDVRHRYSRGKIHGLALWMPPGCDVALRNGVRAAAFAIRRLAGRGIDVLVAPMDGHRPLAVLPESWERASCLWTTAFPAIHERHRSLDLPEIARWCRHAGLPEPIAFRAARAPFVRGGVDLAPVEVQRPGRSGMPYSHVAIRFAEPIPGPVVIGSGRQRGFGLCVPLEDSANMA